MRWLTNTTVEIDPTVYNEALATDPNVMQKTGQVLRVRDLARSYGFTDLDGRQPA